jgi:hypothetical protein
LRQPQWRLRSSSNLRSKITPNLLLRQRLLPQRRRRRRKKRRNKRAMNLLLKPQ